MYGFADGIGYGCDYEDYSCPSIIYGGIVSVQGFVMPGDDYNVTVPNEVMHLRCVGDDMSYIHAALRVFHVVRYCAPLFAIYS